MLEAEKIKDNWERYRSLVNDLFPIRKDALNKMYDELEDRMVFMPASSMEHFHIIEKCKIYMRLPCPIIIIVYRSIVRN